MNTPPDLQHRIETLGPAERILQTLLTHTDHAVHNRSGVVVPDGRTVTGVRWDPATWKEEAGADGASVKVAYRLTKEKKKTVSTRAGVLRPDGSVFEGGRVVATYRTPGLFPEVALWMWRQIADVYQLDNEFVARWASHAFGEEHRDLKVALAAFLLVQPRRGDPVKDNGKVAFFDDDFRDVGEAMCLLRRTDGRDLNPKLLLRIHDWLVLPGIAQLNRDLGFGISSRNPTLGRWPKVVERWLRHREQNPRMLEGLVKAGFRTTVMSLAMRVRYKPESEAFFRILRWKQKQSPDGRRHLQIGTEVSAAASWASLNETQVCQQIVATRPNWKRLTGLLPPSVGLTRAVVAAAVEAGSLSNADLVILTPTLEDLGLLGVEPVKSRWEAAIQLAENQRASNLALRVRKAATVEKLAEASDAAVKKAVAEVIRGLRVYFFLDISGSMSASIEQGKKYIAAFLQGIPLENLHAAVFNTAGRVVTIKHASAAGVEQAFRGIAAGGGTDYGSGVLALSVLPPAADEDALFLFVGDEQHQGGTHHGGTFEAAVVRSGLRPVAFGLLKVGGSESDRGVRDTATRLGIPCFRLDEQIFADPYAVTRTLRNLIAAAPVTAGRAPTVTPVRVSLIEKVLKTNLLQKPAWALATVQAGA